MIAESLFPFFSSLLFLRGRFYFRRVFRVDEIRTRLSSSPARLCEVYSKSCVLSRRYITQRERTDKTADFAFTFGTGDAITADSARIFVRLAKRTTRNYEKVTVIRWIIVRQIFIMKTYLRSADKPVSLRHLSHSQRD